MEDNAKHSLQIYIDMHSILSNNGSLNIEVPNGILSIYLKPLPFLQQEFKFVCININGRDIRNILIPCKFASSNYDSSNENPHMKITNGKVDLDNGFTFFIKVSSFSFSPIRELK